MTMITVPLPQGLFRMRSGSFRLRSFQTVVRSSFKPSVPRREGARDQLWSVMMESTAMSRAETIELEAWFARLEDKDWGFSAYDPLRQFTLGVGGGFDGTNDEILFTDDVPENLSFCSDFSILEGATNALVKTAASRGARSIAIKGLATSLDGSTIVKKGDHIGIGIPGEMNLHMATSNAVCDSSGEARIDFIAPLWKQALVNDRVEFYRPTARFVLADEESGQIIRDPGHLASTSAVAIEVPYQEANA